jgi:hypothetical protein
MEWLQDEIDIIKCFSVWPKLDYSNLIRRRIIMCKKLIYFVSAVVLLGSVSQAENIKWTDLGTDHLWSTPENWDLGRVPTLDDEVLIDVPAAAAPNGPVIQDGIDAKAKGIWTEAAGEFTLTMTGGTLEVAEWIWWGHGVDSFGIWDMSGGDIIVGSEFELGWGGGAGTLTITGGMIITAEVAIPTGSGAFGGLYLYGGTYNVTTVGGLNVTENGMIDITEGTLVLEGDETAKINDLIAAGLVTAYGGVGKFKIEYHPRKNETTVTAIPAPEPVNPGPEGLVVYYPLDNDVLDASGNGNDGTTYGDPTFVEGVIGMGMEFDGNDHVDTGNTDLLAVWTVACWVKSPHAPSGDDPSGPVHRETNYQVNWNHGWDVFRASIAVYAGGRYHPAKYGPVEADTWYHLAGTYDGKVLRAYKNGALITTNDAASGPLYAEPESLKLAKNSANPCYFTGTVDEVVIYNRSLSEGEVMYLSGERATPVDPGSDGLVAYYTLDDDVNDSSSNELHGTIVGEPTYVEGPAGCGTAIAFDGINDYVDFGNNPLFNITEQITLAVWVKANDMLNNEHNPWLGKGDHCYAIKHQSGNFLEFFIYDGGWKSTQYYDYDESLNGEWHHATGTYDGSNLKFYLDGEVVATLAHVGSIETREHPVTMGTNSEAGGRFYDGALDEGVIYDRALSAGEVRFLAGFSADR